MAASSVSGECGSADPFARDACVPPTHPVERGTRFERLRTSQRRSKTDPKPILNAGLTKRYPRACPPREHSRACPPDAYLVPPMHTSGLGPVPPMHPATVPACPQCYPQQRLESLSPRSTLEPVPRCIPTQTRACPPGAFDCEFQGDTPPKVTVTFKTRGSPTRVGHQ